MSKLRERIEAAMEALPDMLPVHRLLHELAATVRVRESALAEAQQEIATLRQMCATWEFRYHERGSRLQKLVRQQRADLDTRQRLEGEVRSLRLAQEAERVPRGQ
jgi:hypothetical protein